MHICDVLIRLTDETSANTTTSRQNVTPAEVAILRFAKGPNSVIFNGNLRRINRHIRTEIARLQTVHKEAFSTMFPGVVPIIPTDFDQIGFDTSYVPQGEPWVPAPDDTLGLEEELEDAGHIEQLPLSEDPMNTPSPPQNTAATPTPTRKKSPAKKKKPAEDFS